MTSPTFRPADAIRLQKDEIVFHTPLIVICSRPAGNSLRGLYDGVPPNGDGVQSEPVEDGEMPDKQSIGSVFGGVKMIPTV